MQYGVSRIPLLDPRLTPILSYCLIVVEFAIEFVVEGLLKPNTAIGAFFTIGGDARHAGGTGWTIRWGVGGFLRSILGGKGGQNLLGGLKVFSRDRENQLGTSATWNRIDYRGDSSAFERFGEGANL